MLITLTLVDKSHRIAVNTDLIVMLEPTAKGTLIMNMQPKHRLTVEETVEEIVSMTTKSTTTKSMITNDEPQHELEILPCPFCGGEPTVYGGGNDGDTYDIGCTNAHCSINPHMKVDFNTKSDAVEVWNERSKV